MKQLKLIGRSILIRHRSATSAAHIKGNYHQMRNMQSHRSHIGVTRTEQCFVEKIKTTHINRLSFSTLSGSNNYNNNENRKDEKQGSSSTNQTETGTTIATLTDILQERINCGELQYDKAQQRAGRRLNRLQKALLDYNESKYKQQLISEMETNNDSTIEEQYDTENKSNNSSSQSKSSCRSHDELSTNQQKRQENKTSVLKHNMKEKILVPRGLFLHGSVGTGKSMLMDVFYQHVPIEKKRRVHFHSFMQDVHKRIHALKQHDLKTRGRSFHVDYVSKPSSSTISSSDENTHNDQQQQPYQNPIDRVALQLATEVTLLCFDEFQVTDVADALILSQLFSTLFAKGTVMVATSNRPPCDLYEGGINRGYFLPFLDLLQQHCIVHPIESSTDYRQLFVHDNHSNGDDDEGDNNDRWKNHFFVVPKEEQDVDDTATTCQNVYDQLLDKNDQSSSTSMELKVGFNRKIQVSQGDPHGLVCWFDFQDLCCQELGSLDYRSIAQHFSVVIVENVPILTLKEHDQARRFITLVDELYEGKCAVLCSTIPTAPTTSPISNPEDLFVNGYELPNTAKKDALSGIELKVGEAFGIDVAQSNGKTAGELASVRELSFAFKRASSRLTEMCSRPWWDKVLENA